VSATMSAAEVAPAVAAAKQGRLPEPAQAPARPVPEARNVDFSRPTKFSAEQERKLRRALETFSRTAATRLSAEFRVPVELEVVQSAQLTWSNAHSQLAPDAICAALAAEPIGTRMLLSAELAFVLAGIERLLGATGQVPRERRLTDIDWALTHRLFGSLTGELSAIWRELAELELSVIELDTRAASAQMAPVNEPTLAITMEIRVDRSSGTVTLLLPWRSVAPVVEHFTSDDGRGETDDDEAGAETVRSAMRGVEVVVRAEVGAAELTLADVLALQPGDLVRLQSPAGTVTLCSGDVAVHSGRPGRNGARRAVQVLAPIEPGS
jgi:flagellar motor switch protein FliM